MAEEWWEESDGTIGDPTTFLGTLQTELVSGWAVLEAGGQRCVTKGVVEGADPEEVEEAADTWVERLFNAVEVDLDEFTERLLVAASKGAGSLSLLGAFEDHRRVEFDSEEFRDSGDGA